MRNHLLRSTITRESNGGIVVVAECPLVLTSTSIQIGRVEFKVFIQFIFGLIKPIVQKEVTGVIVMIMKNNFGQSVICVEW